MFRVFFDAPTPRYTGATRRPLTATTHADMTFACDLDDAAASKRQKTAATKEGSIASQDERNEHNVCLSLPSNVGFNENRVVLSSRSTHFNHHSSSMVPLGALGAGNGLVSATPPDLPQRDPLLPS